MPTVTTAYAKNIIRRSFRELVDPTPAADQLEVLWLHFASRCAYCGREPRPGQKEAHIDHLISAARGGPNHLSNRVLSCAQCNEIEKRDLEWQKFLRGKCNDAIVFDERRRRIVQWCERQKPAEKEDAMLFAKAAALADEVVVVYEQKIAELRSGCL